jgi:hypothetical protein
MAMDHSWDRYFLGWWPLLFSLEWWGHFLVWGIWFPSHLPLKRTNRNQNFGCNRWPMVAGVSTPIVAPEPSVEWVAGANNLMVGGTGSHIILWALLWDSIARLLG